MEKLLILGLVAIAVIVLVLKMKDMFKGGGGSCGSCGGTKSCCK